jgi:hypothetical protein
VGDADFEIIRLGGTPSTGEPLNRLPSEAFTEVERSPISGRLEEAAAGEQATFIGAWQSPADPGVSYVLIADSDPTFDPNRLAETAGLNFIDNRAVRLTEGPSLYLYKQALFGLATGSEPVSIGPEVEACPKCGGYGMHFSPPH